MPDGTYGVITEQGFPASGGLGFNPLNEFSGADKVKSDLDKEASKKIDNNPQK